MYAITDQTSLHQVMQSPYDVVVIDIYADWCQPCKYLTPKMENLAAQFRDQNILFCTLNAETKLKDYVRGLPTIEFWTKKKGGGERDLYHTVLGADFNEVMTVMHRLYPHLTSSTTTASGSTSGGGMQPTEPSPLLKSVQYPSDVKRKGETKNYKTYATL
jgi:hypothetical protein